MIILCVRVKHFWYKLFKNEQTVISNHECFRKLSVEMTLKDIIVVCETICIDNK